MKSKDVLDTFKALGIEKKSGASADADEFELFLNHLTNLHQIKDLEAYRNGKTKISTVKESKPLPKPEVAPAPQKTAEAPAVKPATPVAKPTASVKADERPAPATSRPNDRPAAPTQRSEQRPDQRQDQRRPQDTRRDFTQNRDGDRKFNKYSAAPQFDPFAKKKENMNKAAQGQRPLGYQAPKRPETPVQTPAPAPVQVKKPLEPQQLPAQKQQMEKLSFTQQILK